jgi:RHS repeat-associated protein
MSFPRVIMMANSMGYVRGRRSTLIRAGALFTAFALAASTLSASVRLVGGPPAGPPGGVLTRTACGNGGTGAAPVINQPALGAGGAATVPAYQAVVDPRAPGDASQAKILAYDGAQLAVAPKATALPVAIGITPLAETDLPKLDSAMTNVTQGPRRGYRFTPHPFQFQQPIEITLPYDPALVGTAISAKDVYTYYFDEQGACWRPLERVSVDEQKHVVVSRTNHFTDMVNATVAVPDHPGDTSFNPTQIKDIQAADPGSGVNLIAPPGPSNTGDAKLSYPIEVPPGRANMQPQLSVAYNSAAGDGWLGLGWDVAIPAITVDTRWGVPRYDGGLETETYLLGDQLTPVANRGAPQARSAEKVFHPRVEGAFAQIIRHGDAPTNYTWEVVDKSGTHSFYGGAPEATLADDAGNVFSWALREVRDAHGNVMRYHTVRQDDPGLAAGGSVPGRNLYLQRITYTGGDNSEGPYTVTFLRDRDLGEARRPDVTIDARGGFKRVTADLLRRVEVSLNGQPIRKYELTYQTGAFFKTLLKSVSQFGEDGKLFDTHTFNYFDDIRNGAGQYQAFKPVDWTSPNDNLSNGAVDGVSGGAGQAGALNANTSTSAGGHLYVGFGPTLSKSNSVGIKTGFNHSEDTGLLALIDVDGDNLPDKVFVSGGGVVYRKNLSTPGGQPRFSDEVKPLRNLPGILSETSNSLTVGIEGYPGGVAAQLDHVDTFTTTSRYFTDVNGDGITDLVDGGTVLFGRVGPDGAPVYGVSSDTPVPIGSAPVDTTGLLPDLSADQQRQIDSHPLVDTVRRWVAPFDGTVSVSGDVHLIQDTTAARAAYTKADGVRVAVQHEDGELWSQQIDATDYTAHTPTGVDAIAVKRGERLYFRVQSRFDGAFDQVSWDPRIAYAGAPDVTDVNGLRPYQYQASRDFTLGGRANSVTVPVTGTMHLSGALTKKAATTDDVTALVTRNGETVFEKTMPAAQTGDIPIDVVVAVQQGQQLQWRVRIDSPIDLDQITWTPKADYTAAQGVARLTNANGQPALSVQPPYNVDMYPADSLTAPQQSFTAPAGGTLTVTPTLAFDFGGQKPNSRVVFTVKRRGELLGKKVIDIADGQVPADLGLTVPVNAGDELFFDFSTLDTQLAPHLTNASVQAGLDAANLAAVPSAFHSAAEEGAFAQPYRGWGVVGYNGNRDRAGQPIAQGDLVANADYRNQLPTSVDPAAQRDAFAADPKVTPPKFFQFFPAPVSGRWGAGDLSWVTRDAASSSRLGGPAVNLPAAGDFATVTAVPRMSRSTQISLTGGVDLGVGTIGGSVASGDSVSQLDYLDMNGDGFPDVVGANGIQYTDPTGQLGGTRASLPDGSVRKTSTTTGNASAGSAARAVTTGRGYAAPPAYTTANTADSGNDLPPLGVGGSLGSGKSSGAFDLIDVNGDGLPDRVYKDGRVALNLGYKFAAPEQWPGAGLTDGATTNSGLSIGFNTDFYGLAGGASFSNSRSNAQSSLVDVNGDGLLDRVFDGNPMQVALNTGNGFAPPQPFLGSLPGVNADANAKLGGGGYFKFGLCFLVVTGCIVINPGADVSTGASRTEQVLRDINGDGFADQLQSTQDGQLTVAQNQTGRTNMLMSVARPLGSRIELDYTRDGNTYDQPQSRWVLSRVAVNDGQPGDGQDVQLATYRYAGGVYDRLEREFHGYHTVVEERRDPGASDALYRSVTREYRNDSHYRQGLPTRELTADAAGHPFRETVNSYLLRDVLSPATSADPKSTTATIFPQLVRTDQRFYEGQPAPGKSTFTEMAYDDVGNLIRSFDSGDVGTGDDVETLTHYTVEDPACRASNIVGVGNVVDVRGNGTVLRHRESTVDCATGNVTQNRGMLADGTAAVTDLTYFDNGTLRSVTGPPNAKGQRYRLDYTYDPTISAHIASTADSFGYHSTATYNLKYGQPETTTDINNQQMRYTYDTVGRTNSVTGPYEIADGHVSVTFEYHPEASVPYAVTRHIDRNSDGSVRTDAIDTITFTDGLKRVLQTKKDAAVSSGPGASPADVMTVSGRVVFDFLGRTVAQYYPTTEPKGATNTTFNPVFDTVAPTRTSYDVVDRSTRVTLPNNTTSTTAYGFGPDRAGTTQFETTVTDANGNTQRTYTDVRQRTTAVKQANPAGGQPVIWTSYGYDPLDELTKVIDDHNNITTSTFDNFGRRTVINSPDTGRTETVFDLAGNRIQQITAKLAAKQQSIAYDYDFNRLTAIRYPLFDKNNVSYKYGAPGAPNNGANRIVKVLDAAGTLDREYGPLGELTKETRTVHGFLDHDEAYSTKYRYDTWNRVQQLTYPDGEVLTYHYNSGGQVDTATGVKGTYTYPYLTRLDYDKFDQRVLLRTGNGTQTTYAYNADDRRLATLQATLPTGSTFQNMNYSYDNVGNITTINNNTPTPTPTPSLLEPEIGGPSTQTFGYDNLNRLTSSQGQFHPNTDKTNQYQLAMSYDSINNITNKNQLNQIVEGHSTDTQHQTTYNNTYMYQSNQPHAPSDIGPVDDRYDTNGNLISSTQPGLIPDRRQLVWDEENRLACTRDGFGDTVPQQPSSCGPLGDPSVRFTYDDQGNRVIKDGGPLDVNVYPSPTFSQHNLTAFKHIFIGTTRLASKLVEPDRFIEDHQFYFHPDNLGSTGYGTDKDGRLVEHQQYFPSGETWVDQNRADPSPYQFTGKELDKETGLYYYGARYYDPRSALWQSPDPAAGSYLSGAGNDGVYNPANLAAYTYTYNNPVRLTDPNGRQTLLTSTELAALGRANNVIGSGARPDQLKQAMGYYFEDAAIRSMGMGPRTNEKFFVPGSSERVEPEAVRPTVTVRDGMVVGRLQNGGFLEAKSQVGDVVLSDRNYQMKKYIDILADQYAQAGGAINPDVPKPWLIYVTTSDSGISPSARKYAEDQGVALFQASMAVIPTADPLRPMVQVTGFLPANPTAVGILLRNFVDGRQMNMGVPSTVPVPLFNSPYDLIRPLDPAQP